MKLYFRSHQLILLMSFIFVLGIGLSGAYAQDFVTVAVDTTDDVGLYTSIALDSANKPYISYYDATNSNLKHATMSDGTWDLQTVDNSADVGLYTSIVVDSVGNSYVSYYDRDGERLKLAHTEAGSWVKKLGPSARITNKTTSIALCPGYRNPFIAYFDYNGGHLRLSMYDRANSFDTITDAQGWALGPESVMTSNSMGDISLALDSATNPHLSCISWTGIYADLWYAKKQYSDAGCLAQVNEYEPTGEGTWNPLELVDNSDTVGEFASIGVDSYRNPHISYYKQMSGDLMYATKSGVTWDLQTVDNSSSDVGQYTSIAIDSDNNPHISYYDDTNGALKYATKSGGAWIIRTVDNVGDVGLYTSIALDSNGKPHISYYDAANGDLKYAFLAKERLCFPPHRGVPYDNDPPEIDGRVQEDVGWRGAYRLTYGNGTDTAHVAFQGLKHNSDPYLYLSFEVRNDPTFDSADVIVINFRPSANGGSVSNDRRIFIFPLCDDIGAGGPNCTLDTPDDKVDRPPKLFRVWKNSENWVELGSGQPTNLDVKVRSFTNGSSKAWNVEVMVPTSVAAGGSEWIDFSDEFLFYFNVIRASSLDAFASEFRWPRNAPEVSSALDSYPFSPAEWGEGTKNSTARCKGVWLEWSDVGTNNSPSSSIKFTTPPNTFTNTFVSTVRNDTEIGGVPQPAEDVRVRFRIANWGIPGLGDWNDIPAANPGCPDPGLQSNPTCPQDIPPADSQVPGTRTFNLKWMVPDEDIPEYQAHDHQCILAELDSDSNTNIITKSVHRNMDFVPASRFSRSAQISTKGYGAPPNAMSEHRFALHVTTKEEAKTVSEDKKRQVGDGLTESLLTWAAHGYLYSGRSIIINRQRYSLVDPVGSFGYIVKHVGDPVKKWQHKLEGAKKVATNLYRLSIPSESAVPVTTQITPLSYGRWSASIHSGVAIPTGSFADDFDSGLNILLDVDYRLSPKWSLVGLCGYNDFKSNTTGVDDNYWINLSTNMRYQQPLRGPLSYYIGAGPGVYIPEAGSTEFGANIGVGFDYKYNSSTTIEIGVDYHRIFDGDTQFLHSHAGIIFHF